jgi:hypothetical protein
MSNTRRPSAARQHTRTSKAAKDAEMDLGLTIKLDGEEYTVRQGEMTSMDTMALRRETGYSFRGLIEAFQRDPDIDLIAALVWLARRLGGERLLSFEEVATGIDYDADLDLIEVAEPESDPEA